MTWAVVVPTNRPDRYREFIAGWHRLFAEHDTTVCPVYDAPTRYTDSGWAWPDLPDWIPRQTDMCRSWGIYQAWLSGATYTLSLDDDVLPDSDVFAEYERVFEAGAPVSAYLDVGALTSSGLHMRGFPYRDRNRAEVAVQYGGWNGVLDYDACTQLAVAPGPATFAQVAIAVPKGAAVTGCAMNMAFRTEVAPIMWQLPLLDGRYNRFGDIWAGLFAKRVLDSLGKAVVVNGRATVRHDRASDPVANLAREQPGIAPNEHIFDALPLPSGDLTGAYQAVTDQAASYFHERDPSYADWFISCRNNWLDLYR